MNNQITYLKLKNKHEKDINKFPLFFAFDNKQFEKGLKELKTTKENLRSIDGGGFMRKDDIKKWYNLLLKQQREHKKQFKNKEYVYNMFRYELANHEYIITYDLEDTLNSLGITFKELDKNKLLLEQLNNAKNDYLESAEEWA